MGRAPRVWTVFVAYAVAFVAMLAASLAILAVALVALVASGTEMIAALKLIESEASSRRGILTSATLSGVCVLGVTVCATHFSPVTFGRRLRLGPSGLSLGWSCLAVIACIGVSWVLGEIPRLFGDLGLLDHLLESQRHPSAASLAGSLLIVAGLAPIAEELFFRGYMQTRLEERWGRWPAIGVTSVLFGVFHMNAPQGIAAGLFGVCLGWVAAVTSVRVSIAAHAANNALFVVTMALGLDRVEGIVRLGENGAALAVAIVLGFVVVRKLH
jgi:membrane protease YdiL (CAAX protease family)